MVTTIFNTFDPDMKITAAEGKTFIADTTRLKLLSQIKGISCYSLTIEENALLKYGDRQYIATIKGVDDNYASVSNIDSSMWEGEFKLKSPNGRPYAVPGIGIAQYLGIRVNFIYPINIYVPRRDAGTNPDPENAFNRNYIFPSGIFQVEQEYDSKYLYLPLDYTQELTEKPNQVSAIEIKFMGNADGAVIQKNVKKIFGKDFIVQNRYEQQEIFYQCDAVRTPGHILYSYSHPYYCII